MAACTVCGEPTRSRLQICHTKPACRKAYYKAAREVDIEAYRAKYRDGNRIRARNWRAANPEKERAKSKRWRDANPDSVAAKGKRWREANAERAALHRVKWAQANRTILAEKERRRRSLKRGVPSAPFPFELMRFLQKDMCTLCGLELSDPVDIDHIVPLSLGGWDVPGNLAITHAKCNRVKGNRVNLDEPECVAAILRASLFVQRCPSLVTFPEGVDTTARTHHACRSFRLSCGHIRDYPGMAIGKSQEVICVPCSRAVKTLYAYPENICGCEGFVPETGMRVMCTNERGNKDCATGAHYDEVNRVPFKSDGELKASKEGNTNRA